MIPTLSIHDLSISFPRRGAPIRAVQGVSLTIAPSECVGIIGESGSGKTQVFMAAMGLLASNAAVSGNIRFEGGDLLSADTAVLNRVRGSKLTMIFQDPMTSLAPHLKIGTQLAEVLCATLGCRGAMRGVRRPASWRACGCLIPSAACINIRMSSRVACGKGS